MKLLSIEARSKVCQLFLYSAFYHYFKLQCSDSNVNLQYYQDYRMLNRENRSRRHTNEVRKRSNERYFKLIFRQMSSELSKGCFKTDRKKISTYHLSRKSMIEKGNSRNNSFKDSKEEIGFQCNDYHKMSTGNLNIKLKEIENIRNFQNCRRIKKKKIPEFNGIPKNDWGNKKQSICESQKMSKSIYQYAKNRCLQIKEKKQSCSFVFPRRSGLTQQQLTALSQEKPNQICNFVRGFPNNCKNEEVQQLTQITNLGKMKSNIKKSQILSNCVDNLIKNGHTDKVKDNQIGPNFISAVKTMQYIRKNGVFAPKSKTMLQMSMCLI